MTRMLTALITGLVVSFLPEPARAGEKILLKRCSAVLRTPGVEGSSLPTTFAFYRNGDSYEVRYSHLLGEEQTDAEEGATVRNYPVRAGLTADSRTDGLNYAELLVVEAMIYRQKFTGAPPLNFDLEKVRAATVFTVGEMTNVAATSVVEALDAAGNELGSYLGGFAINPCEARGEVKR